MRNPLYDTDKKCQPSSVKGYNRQKSGQPCRYRFYLPKTISMRDEGSPVFAYSLIVYLFLATTVIMPWASLIVIWSNPASERYSITADFDNRSLR